MTLSAHIKAQAARFARISVATFFASGVLTSVGVTRSAVLAAVVASLETAFRQVFPVA